MRDGARSEETTFGTVPALGRSARHHACRTAISQLGISVIESCGYPAGHPFGTPALMRTCQPLPASSA
eukprot:3238399-Alexandrium_andersonii.AAC.1